MIRTTRYATFLSRAALTGAFLASFAMAQTASDVTYNVDLSILSGTVIGQIVTNGAVGVLTSADIVSWEPQS